MTRVALVTTLATAVLALACSRSEGPTSAQVPPPKRAGRSILKSEQTHVAIDAKQAAPSLPPSHVRAQEDCAEGMLFVPGGRFTYRGRPYDTVSNAPVVRELDVHAFCIGRIEVTAYQFVKNCPKCLLVSGCESGSDANACTTREQAEQYCKASLGEKGRLPSPQEFLFAAIGQTGNRFPWGSTFYPWGQDAFKNRPINAAFCDWEVSQGQVTKARRLLFSKRGCGLDTSTLDTSPYGVRNLGTDVLEWTSGNYRDDQGKQRCTVLGLDFSQLETTGFPPDTDLVARPPVYCDGSLHESMRALDIVGFRCAISEK